MKEILTRLIESMKLIPRKRFIKYLMIIIKINPNNQLRNNETIKKSILEIIKEEKLNINENNIINLNINELKLIYILIKYKTITRERNYKLENYTYLFNSNTFTKIFNESNKTIEKRKTNEIINLKQKKSNEEQINIENYYIILIENLRIIKQYLEIENIENEKQNIKFWLIKILDEIEKDLYKILSSTLIQFDLIYTINFLIETLFEIIKNTESKLNINLYKNLINSNNNIFNSKIFNKFHISILQNFFINLLNESINSFVFEAKEINYKYFFLVENILIENNSKQILNEIKVIKEFIPFFLLEYELNKLINISNKTRLLKSINEGDEINLKKNINNELKKLKVNNIFYIKENKIETNINLLENIEKELDISIKKYLIESLEKYLKFLKYIFLNERSDFLTTLIKKLSKIEKLSENKSNFCKRSVTFLLTDSIQNSLNDYEKDLDIIFKDEEEGLNIILKPRYPFNLFIDRNLSQILSLILKFYMKLKRVELMTSSLKIKLSKKVRNNKLNFIKLINIHKIINLINKIYTFLYLKFKDWNISSLNIFESKNILKNFNKLIKTSDIKTSDIKNFKLINSFKESNIKYLSKIIKSIEIFCISGDETHLIFSINEILNSDIKLLYLKDILLKIIS